jgi:hypothetical protein
MKTLFMNPAGKISSFSGAKSNMMNPRRSYRRKSRRKARRNSAVRLPKFSNPRRKRSRRRNAGITPFVQRNPLILQNPRRRRRGRRNPTLNFNTILSKTLTYTGGAAVGAGANILALRRIENDWLRNGARLATAIAAGYFMKGEMGAAAAGATLYPMFAELALMFNLTGGGTASPTGVDLNELAADLEAALDEVNDNDLMYVP